MTSSPVQSRSGHMGRIVLTIAAISAVVIAAGAVARARMAPCPAVIATVDLGRVLNGLDEKGVRESDLDLEKNELQAGIDRIKSELDSLLTQAEVRPEGSAERKALLKQANKLRIQMEFELQISERILVSSQGEILADLYSKIQLASQQMASNNGYTMVLVSDLDVPVPSRGSPGDITAAIFRKRMLYLDECHDITSELITFMNNKFAAAH